MELNIKLIGNIGRLNKREPFIIADNEKLVLNFSCATPLTDYYIELKTAINQQNTDLMALLLTRCRTNSCKPVLWKSL